MTDGDGWIRALRDRSPEGDWETPAQGLRDEFAAGFPVDRLIPLLHSDDLGVSKPAALILSRLGALAEPLLGEVPRLLGHPDRWIRRFTIDTVLGTATEDHGVVIAQAVGLVGDPSGAVRRKVLNLLSRMADRRLAASLPYLPPPVDEPTSWLLAGPAPADVLARLTDPDPVRRRFAAAAAVRGGGIDENRLLESADRDVSTFARWSTDQA